MEVFLWKILGEWLKKLSLDLIHWSILFLWLRYNVTPVNFIIIKILLTNVSFWPYQLNKQVLWAANCTSIPRRLQWPFQTLTFPRHRPHPLDSAPDPALVHGKLKAWVHQLDTHAPVGNRTGQSVTVLSATLGSVLKESSSVWPSQSFAGGKGPLEFILCKPSARAGPPRPSCPAPCPDSSWASPRREIPWSLWAPCASTWSTPQWKSASSRSEGTSRSSVCAHFLWARLRRAWLCLLDSLPC